MAATLRRDLLRPMVQRTFGERAPVPEIVFQVDPKEDLDALTDRIVKLSKAGVDIGQRWVREALGIPDPEKDDALIGGSVPDDTAPGALPAPAAPEEQPDGPTPGGEPKASGEAGNETDRPAGEPAKGE
jgi:phage gp29-like protein